MMLNKGFSLINHMVLYNCSLGNQGSRHVRWFSFRATTTTTSTTTSTVAIFNRRGPWMGRTIPERWNKEVTGYPAPAKSTINRLYEGFVPLKIIIAIPIKINHNPSMQLPNNKRWHLIMASPLSLSLSLFIYL